MKKILITLCIGLLCAIAIAQSSNVVQGVSKTPEQIKEQLHQDLIGGYFSIIAPEDASLNSRPSTKNIIRFKRNGSFKCKLKQVTSKGEWKLVLREENNHWDIQLKTKDSTHCITIQNRSGWARRSNQLTPWSIHGSLDNSEITLQSNINFRKRKRHLR